MFSKRWYQSKVTWCEFLALFAAFAYDCAVAGDGVDDCIWDFVRCFVLVCGMNVVED